MKKLVNEQRGFTLIELLVVLAVVGTAGSVVVAILFTSLRGANKATTISTLRQNGTFAISQIGKTVRNAKRFGGVSIDGTPTSYAATCTDPTIPYKYVKVSTLTATDIVYACTATNILANGSSLLDENAVAFEPSSCFFTCQRGEVSDLVSITIQFSLKPKTESVLVERIASPIPFKTTVTLRNLAR